jgi:hypothetical protein
MGRKETKKISEALTTAREKGLIPWDWIVDETRAVERKASWGDPDAYMQTAKTSYRLDRWTEQPQRLLVVSEKGTIGGTLRPVLHEYGVGFLVLHGFGSATALNDLAEFAAEDERPLTLIYVGDHDPSGRHMSNVDIPKRLSAYGGVANILRMAILPSQISRLGLSTFSAHEKQKDSRYRWFLDTYGETCCELDAMNPNVLRALVERAITDRIDADSWERAGTTEQAQLRSLGEFFDTWTGLEEAS